MSSQGDSASKHSATFFLSVASSGAVYVPTTITNGLYFNVGDSITIPGTSLGGATPTNDAIISVATIRPNTSIGTLSYTGTSASGASTTYPAYFGTYTFVPPAGLGYAYKDFNVRDSSDWITLRKQAIISALNTPAGPKGESFSNSSRLDLRQGRYKVGAAFGCSGCFGNAFQR